MDSNESTRLDDDRPPSTSRAGACCSAPQPGRLASRCSAAGRRPDLRPLGRRRSDPRAGRWAVSGVWDRRFKRVRDEFIRNFTDRGEVGAAVSIIAGGRRVVDLWGGTARVETAEPWQEDTIVHVWSCTKGATALCAHILAARGLLDLDAPVVDYWPEFGQNGKEGTTVAMLLSHQAGVPAVRDPLPPGAFYDHEFMTETLAAEARSGSPARATAITR